MEKVTLKIEGMHCGACANGIQMMLSYKDGVSNAEVSYEKKKGLVEYDPAEISINEIVKTVASTGEYSATVSED
ncbi:MAG: cation transporter [Candidatus Hydrothermarchaeales archaeon]